jgi:protoporphyrinogen oxidase
MTKSEVTTEPRTAVLIGAGPAGLTAAYEMLTRLPGTRVVIVERDPVYVGGISRTVNYKGNRLDIGGHRFFSKSDRVMDWWLSQLPMEGTGNAEERIRYQNQERIVAVKDRETADPVTADRVMLVRQRTSRVYYLRKFFAYPITLSPETLGNLGLLRSIKIGFSYLQSTLFPIRPETTLEEFFINRFGRELYRTFFQSYTEKVWGVPCNRISAEWGAQRIKGLSIGKAIAHFVKGLRKGKAAPADGSTPTGEGIAQKGVETSLIEQFFYPKYGPGQMWETVAERVRALGAEIIMGADVVRIGAEEGAGDAAPARVTEVEVRLADGATRRIAADLVFSTMAVQDLVRALDAPVPDTVREISEGLVYRDFLTVGLLLDRVKMNEPGPDGQPRLVRDNWIYIQEPDVRIGRLQIFNNWSPSLVAAPDTVWLGLEYFCNEGDDLWRMPDADMIQLGTDELQKIGFIEPDAVRDATVVRYPKTYPAYFGTYDRFSEVRDYLDGFENLFLIGRNGMHRYNNQDHSMLTAMVAVDNLVAGRTDKSNLWDVNTEQEYHESKSGGEAEH